MGKWALAARLEWQITAHLCSRFVVDFVTDYDSSLHGSLLTSDLNATEPFNTAFPLTYNLSDEYLALGGEEGMGISVSSVAARQVWLQSDGQGAYCWEVEVQGLEQVSVSIRICDDLWIGGWGVLMWIRDGDSWCRNWMFHSSCSTFQCGVA